MFDQVTPPTAWGSPQCCACFQKTHCIATFTTLSPGGKDGKLIHDAKSWPELPDSVPRMARLLKKAGRAPKKAVNAVKDN
jgi:hypothetical protein